MKIIEERETQKKNKKTKQNKKKQRKKTKKKTKKTKGDRNYSERVRAEKNKGGGGAEAIVKG